MRHLTAAQKGEGGGWHYVSMSRDGGHPIGSCGEHEPHATEAEARECYAAYLRSQVVLGEGTWSWSGCESEDCDNPTRSAARVKGYDLYMAALCTEHLTVEKAIEVMHLDRPAGDAWVS